MKNKLLVVIAIATTLAIATVAMASGNIITTFFESPTDSTDFSAKVEEDFSFDFNIFEPEYPTAPLFDIIEEEINFNDFAEASIMALNDYISVSSIDPTMQKQIKNRFINTIVDFHMTSEEMDFINSLIQEDYDIELLLDIYEFIRWTDADISVIPQIYHAGEKNSDEKFWIYETYDQLFDRTEDMLSVEDIAYYVSNGITIEEITGAYELSFSGVKTTKQMLNERLSGASWNTIVAPVVSNDPQTIINTPEMSIEDIILYRGYSVKTRKDFSDVISIENDTVTIEEDVIFETNDASALKRTFIKEYDAEIPATERNEQANNSSNHNITPVTIDPEEIIFEEDLIPVEEPEVE